MATCETDADKKAHREVMRDDVAAELKIKDFERRCPNKGAGRKRASYDHCSFAQRWRARSFTTNFRRVRRMDFIESPGNLNFEEFGGGIRPQ